MRPSRDDLPIHGGLEFVVTFDIKDRSRSDGCQPSRWVMMGGTHQPHKSTNVNVAPIGTHLNVAPIIIHSAGVIRLVATRTAAQTTISRVAKGRERKHPSLTLPP